MATKSKRGRRSGTSRRPRTGAEALIALRNEAGEILHVSLPAVTTTLRATVAKLRLADELPKRLGVISAIRGEGVTYISRSFALVLANDTGQRVCMVDTNWSTPARWGGDLGAGGGLAGVVRGDSSLDDALVATGDPALSILPAGEASTTEIPVFAASAALRGVLDDLGHRFDHVVLDLPALHAASEALTLAGTADAVAVVVRQGVTPEGQVKAALELLEGVPVLGVVLNAYSTEVPSAIMRRIPAS